MKKLIFILLLTGSIQGIYAQKAEKKDKFSPNTPLFEELTDVKKKTDKFNISGTDFKKVTSICTNSASRQKVISTTGSPTVTVNALTARTMQTA